MSTLEQQASKPTNTARTLALVAFALLAVLAAAGCGETNKPATNAPAPANAATSTPQGTPATTTTAPAASQASASAPAAGHATKTGASHRGAHRRAGSVLASLGNAKPSPRPTTSQRAHFSIADIDFSSPALRASGGRIPRQYTCDGADHSLPLRWENVPPGTAELAIFAISTTPVNQKLFFAWALAHINPHLSELKPGQTPTGAIEGQNSSGQNTYSICPPAGKPESYVLLIYALPQTLSPTPGFNAETLHKQAIQTARHTGLLLGTYQRP